MAKYKCCSCGKLVCKEPLYCSEGKVWDARQTSFFIDFYRGGYFYGYPGITIQKTSSGNEYKYKLPHGLIFRSMHDPECLQKLNTPINYPKLTEDDWNHIVSTLFDKAHIHEWKSEYFNLDIYDGEQWKLIVKMTGKTISIIGSNAYPPFWEVLCDLFNELNPYI